MTTPASFLSPHGIMAAIIVALSISNFIFVKMYGAANERYHEFRATVAQAQRLAEEQAEHHRIEQERILANYGDSWSAALAADRAVRVQKPANHCPGQMPGISPIATSHEGLQAGSGAGGYLEITIDQCEALANDSILDAEWIDLAKRLTDDLHEGGR